MSGSAPAVHIAVVPVAALDVRAARALEYAGTLTPHVLAVHVRDAEPEQARQLEATWADLAPPVPLFVLDTSPRDGRHPLAQALDVLRRTQRADLITVVMPPRSPVPQPQEQRLYAWVGAVHGPGIVITDTPDGPAATE